MPSTTELLDIFKSMTVLELNDFLKAFEEEFGVTAAAPVAVAAAGGGEDDVELVLLLGGRGGLAASAGRHRDAHGHGSGGGHAELLFEGLEEVVELEDRHVLEDVEELGLAHAGHADGPPIAVSFGRVCGWCGRRSVDPALELAFMPAL